LRWWLFYPSLLFYGLPLHPALFFRPALESQCFWGATPLCSRSRKLIAAVAHYIRSDLISAMATSVAPRQPGAARLPLPLPRALGDEAHSQRRARTSPAGSAKAPAARREPGLPRPPRSSRRSSAPPRAGAGGGGRGGGGRPARQGGRRTPGAAGRPRQAGLSAGGWSFSTSRG
jgi:hypothetical protein